MAIDFIRPLISRDERTLWIHAGPHKAASSYIKERLRSNRDNLAAQGVFLDDDENNLAKTVRLGDYQTLEHILVSLPENYQRILLSSSSLDTSILKSDVLGALHNACSKHKFRLGVSYVVREQHSWINSIYCHRVRRFRQTSDFAEYCNFIMQDPNSWDIDYSSKFRRFEHSSDIISLFLPLSKQVAISDPFLALVSALDLDQPDGPDGWCQGRATKDNIQPGTRGIWMSSLCRRLMVDVDFDPSSLKGIGKVIRDLAIERGWDQEKFDGFDQPLMDRLNAFYGESNERFAQKHWGVPWKTLFPTRPAAQKVYLGPGSSEERLEMRHLMVQALRGLRFPLRLRRRFFQLYDATV